jgi:hypothetical protein
MRAVRFPVISSVASLAAISALALQLAFPTAALAAKPSEPLIFSAHDNPAYVTQAFDINQAGTVVGYYYDANFYAYGFLRAADGTYTDLKDPDAPTATFPRSLNDKGVVVGQSNIDGWGQGWLYNIAKGKFKPVRVPGAKSTYAEAINNHGVIAGYAYFYPDPTKPTYFTASGFLLKDGAYTLYTAPGALYTYIRSINDKGDVAGMYTDATTFASHSFVQKADGTFTIVDAKNAVNHAATIYGLSKKGDSVGTCTDANFTSWGCYYTTATGAVSEFGAGTLGSASPWAIKYSQVVGFGYDASIGKNRGFVIPKADASKN